jgi:hypothetical protein
MPFYEIIFETGNHSVAFYEDDAEAERAIGAHHARAKAGEPAMADNPQMGAAERVNKVLKYDEHPADYNLTQTATPEEVKAVVDEALTASAVGDMVSIPEIAAVVRDISNPIASDSDRLESNYKMAETGELDPSTWEGDTSAA